MRTKRTPEPKKPAARADNPAAASTIASAPRKVTTWVAGIDGLSMGIAGAAIVAAGILVAAYRPAHPVESGTDTTAAQSASAAGTTSARKAGTPGAAATKGAASASASADNWQPAPMTLTGCLERDADAFRLTDTTGVGAPKARSWKSGFLKKNASAVTVIDADRRAHLQDHLGQRVSVTGTMVNKEMQIGTLRLLAESCSDKTKI
jgi:hypothetical protein